jgi:plasminogen activator inhibitor 1 RNA-binding protein
MEMVAVVEEEGAVVIAAEAAVVLLTSIAQQERRLCSDLSLIFPWKLNRLSSDSDKKVHQGWGGDEGGTELKAEEAGNTDAQAEGVAAATDGWDAVPIDDPWGAPPPAQADPWGATPAEGDNTPAPEDEKAGDDHKPRERELEEEDNTISLDQYLAQLKETTNSSIPKLEGIRGANEGAEEDVWGNVVEHKNEEEDAYYVGKVCRRVLD